MKKNLLIPCMLLLILTVSIHSIAQNGLVTDQNPRFEESRAKYMKNADSINAWHSTTIQETYKAIDYLADKAEAREQRRAFRRELRLERARNGWYDDYSYGYGNGNGYGYYRNGYNNFYNHGFYNNGYYGNGFNNNGFYGNGHYGRNRGYYGRNTGYYGRNYRNNYLWAALPLAFTLGYYWR